jgi:hypothetical protein
MDENRLIFLQKRARAARYMAVLMVILWGIIFASIYHRCRG